MSHSQTKQLFLSAGSTRLLFNLRHNNTNGFKSSITYFIVFYEHPSLLKTIAHHELGLHLINQIISNVLDNLFLGTQNSQVSMFYWMYAWSTMYLSNIPVYIGSYRVAYVVQSCLRRLHRFNVLLEISVALVPCILAAMPSNNL